VGDDDQSIYSFRGAVPELMVRFEKEYKKIPGYETLILGVNYRCSSDIVECSTKLISRNKKRFKKELRSEKTSFLNTSTVRFRSFPEYKKEISYVLNMIEDLNAKGIDYTEIAVLFRTNSQPGALVSLLKTKNIPFSVRDNIPNIYEHWIAKNIFAYIELAGLEAGNRTVGPFGSDSTCDHSTEWRRLFLTIANRPVRYISRETMRKEKLDFSVLFQENRGKTYVTERLTKLKYDLGMISKLNPMAAVKYIRKAVGYDEFLKKYASERGLDIDGLIGILDEIEASSAEIDKYEAWKEHIRE
jgi:DNA helicase-2/ATP-dependent DNA helicase PcrA